MSQLNLDLCFFVCALMAVYIRRISVPCTDKSYDSLNRWAQPLVTEGTQMVHAAGFVACVEEAEISLAWLWHVELGQCICLPLLCCAALYTVANYTKACIHGGYVCSMVLPHTFDLYICQDD